MNNKKLQIINKHTGELLEEQEFSGGYHIIYSNLHDAGKLKHIRKLDNAKFGDKHWIKIWIYMTYFFKFFYQLFSYRPINPKSILFIEDVEWEKPDSLRPKNHWMARISKANKQLSEMSGYSCILETRNYFIEKMTREQIIALIYHELRHIDEWGDLQPHNVEDWDNMIATLGKDWATTRAGIQNLINDNVIWKNLESRERQLDVFNLEEFNKVVEYKEKS